MEKVIFILIDGLGYETGRDRMGFLQHLVEHNKGTFHKVICELPTLSRTMYETIFTGLPAYKHGVIGNDFKGMSKEKNIFSVAREKKLTTAASAFYWISELYVKENFDKVKDRFLHNENSNIQNGIFYWDEDYPDNHVYYDAEFLREKYNPDFLLIHPMNVDTRGHRYTSNSTKYRNSALKNDHILLNFVMKWLKQGYKIIVTGDHGISEDGSHGGSLAREREVPFWIIGEINLNLKNEIKQTEIFLIICSILGINN